MIPWRLSKRLAAGSLFLVPLNLFHRPVSVSWDEYSDDEPGNQHRQVNGAGHRLVIASVRAPL